MASKPDADGHGCAQRVLDEHRAAWMAALVDKIRRGPGIPPVSNLAVKDGAQRTTPTASGVAFEVIFCGILWLRGPATSIGDGSESELLNWPHELDSCLSRPKTLAARP